MAGESRTGRRLFHYLRAAGAPALAAGSSDWVVSAGPDGSYPGDEAYFLRSILDTIQNALRSRQDRVEPADLAETRWRSGPAPRSAPAGGAFGAKEVGQGPLLPMMPAVANAVFDAVGALPLTEKDAARLFERAMTVRSFLASSSVIACGLDSTMSPVSTVPAAPQRKKKVQSPPGGKPCWTQRWRKAVARFSASR